MVDLKQNLTLIGQLWYFHLGKFNKTEYAPSIRLTNKNIVKRNAGLG